MKSEIALSRQVAKGGMWMSALRVLDNLLRFARLVIVARILAPGDFGLFGIALLTMSVLEAFSQTGLQTALVQKQRDITSYLDSAWTVSAVRGVLLYSILFIAAPYIALFFNTPQASLIIRAVGATLLLGGFVNIGIIHFQKEMEFNKQFFYRLATTLADFLMVVLAALVLKNVWALVIGLIAGSIAGLVTSYVMHPFRPHFKFDLRKTKELFWFSRWVYVSTVLVFLITQGDDIFVGKFLGAAMLGFYQIAYRFSNMPATEITHVISQVTFPAYSKIQDNLSRLKEAYLRVLHLTAFLSFPIAGLIFILAPDFTQLFLGEKWLPIVPAMQVLACEGLIRSIAATTGPLFYALGRPQIDTRWQMIRLLIIAVLIYPVTIRWGILGTAVVILVSMIVSTIGFSYMAIKITECKARSFGKAVLFPLIHTLIVVSVVFSLKTLLILDGILGFFALIGISIIIYLGLVYASDRYSTYNLQSFLPDSFRPILQLFKG